MPGNQSYTYSFSQDVAPMQMYGELNDVVTTVPHFSFPPLRRTTCDSPQARLNSGISAVIVLCVVFFFF